TLAVRYKGKSIADVLQMRVSEALELFSNIPKIRRVLQTLADVGLDYVSLGQAAPTLSGGEAQRVKLAAELGRPNTGRTLSILDLQGSSPTRPKPSRRFSRRGRMPRGRGTIRRRTRGRATATSLWRKSVRMPACPGKPMAIVGMSSTA